MKQAFEKKIGIFGGSFDPPHKGHEFIVQTCLSDLGFDEIYLIPSYRTPRKIKSQTREKDRLEMLKKVFQNQKEVKILDLEIKRKGASYTIDTLNELDEKGEVHLIMGEDVFLDFPKWKNFQKILNQVHLVVFLRTQGSLSLKDFPVLFSKLIQSKSHEVWKLKNQKEIIFVPPHEHFRLFSSTQIRNQLKFNFFKKENIPKNIHSDIKLYYKYLKSLSQKNLQKDLLQFLESKGALNPKIYFFDQKFYEYLLITSGLNLRHVRFLARSLKEYIKKNYGIEPDYVEGEELHQWIVFDYGFLVIHIFYDYLRNYYQLEELWEKEGKLV